MNPVPNWCSGVLRFRSPPRSFGCVIDKRKAEVAGYAVAAFVLVFLALKFLRHDASGTAGAPVSLEPSGAARRAPARSSGRLLVVDVAGEVRDPGVYRVPSGSRADAAVERAG